MNAVPDWKSFYDLTTPQEAARLMRKWHGDGAQSAAAENGLVAYADNRPDDKRFWAAVLIALKRPLMF